MEETLIEKHEDILGWKNSIFAAMRKIIWSSLPSMLSYLLETWVYLVMILYAMNLSTEDVDGVGLAISWVNCTVGIFGRGLITGIDTLWS